MLLRDAEGKPYRWFLGMIGGTRWQVFGTPWGGAPGLKPEASAPLSHWMVGETYRQNLRFKNSLSRFCQWWSMMLLPILIMNYAYHLPPRFQYRNNDNDGTCSLVWCRYQGLDMVFRHRTSNMEKSSKMLGHQLWKNPNDNEVEKHGMLHNMFLAPVLEHQHVGNHRFTSLDFF